MIYICEGSKSMIYDIIIYHGLTSLKLEAPDHGMYMVHGGLPSELSPSLFLKELLSFNSFIGMPIADSYCVWR